MTKTFTLKDIDGAVVEKRKIIPWTMGYKEDTDYFNLKNGLYNDGIDAQSSVALELDREGLLNEMVNAFKSNDQEINKALRENLKKCADAIRNAPINSILKVVKG